MESIRVEYGKSTICYQGHVQATQLLSGSCTDKRGLSGFCTGKLESIRVVYGKSTICYQGHVRVGRTLYHGARLWNVLLWNVLLWIVLLWNDLLWNDSFRPFSERHFYCVYFILYSSYLLTITPCSPILSDNTSHTLYQISLPGICQYNVNDTRGRIFTQGAAQGAVPRAAFSLNLLKDCAATHRGLHGYYFW